MRRKPDPKKYSEIMGQKYHQKSRLEMIVLDCPDCQRLITHIYLGNFGNLLKPRHAYQCMHCKSLYVSPKKLKYKQP